MYSEKTAFVLYASDAIECAARPVFFPVLIRVVNFGKAHKKST
jgi:hypothetical protein